MNTKYIDLYMYHGLSSGEQLTERLRKWVEDTKKRKLIRFFGFSTHENMADCLLAASKLDWVDAIMTSYNFRLMQDTGLQQAVEACFKAGIGLVAMKVLGHRLGHKIETDEDKKLVEHFLKKGLTEEQAKIKAVLQDKRISSACVGMSNVTELTTNAKAVLDTAELNIEDKQILAAHTRLTCDLYCAGCSQICSKASPDMPYIADCLRYLMYYNSYGDHKMARELFAELPVTKSSLLGADYSLAEAHCPQKLPIGRLISEAAAKLA
jgi:predicted aldo/keto reductase-like oxidoreductase